MIWERGLTCPRPRNCPPREKISPTSPGETSPSTLATAPEKTQGCPRNTGFSLPLFKNDPGKSVHFSNSG